MKSKKILFFLMLLSMAIWGLSWTAAKVLSDYGEASSITYIRFLLVPLTLFPILKLAKIPVAISKKGIPSALLAGILMAGYTILFFNGLRMGLAGAGGVLVAVCIPIFAYLVDLVINKKRPNKSAAIGLLIGGVAGHILLDICSNYQNIFASGNTLFLIAALVYALLSKVISKSANYGSPISFNFWLHIIALVGLTFVVDFTELKRIVISGDFEFWLNMLYFGIINSSIATTTYFYATTKLGAEKASSFIFIVPSAAVFFSWLIMDEPVEMKTIVGGIIGLFAVFIINEKLTRFKSKKSLD
jgi:drug/metabolite transporter (DMT)-like permease